jgi:uncharacterized protein (DUF4415 family)
VVQDVTKEKINGVSWSDAGKHKGLTGWERLRTQTDADIDAAMASDPDAAPILDRAWFEGATLELPAPKQAVSLRVDPDVLSWYRAQGPGYLSRMNAVLRRYAAAHGAALTARSARAKS